MTTPHASLGVFGGSGFYSFLDDVTTVSMHTPYGAPSAAISVGSVDGVSVAFLPRHGEHHETPAHKINFRANLWAMRELGVQRVVGPCAAGSLRQEIAPGEVVILDQFVDRTTARADTFFDGGVPGHISMADPYCGELGTILAKSAANTGITAHNGGTVVVVQGPRFSTRAESAWFRSFGWHAVNMTQYPEVALARELGMCYAGLALITDYDTGVEGDANARPVEMHDVFATLKSNVDKTRALLKDALPAMAEEITCDCAQSLASGPLRPS